MSCPHQITLLLFGSLVALGVGYTIENPQASTVRLTQREERRFRKRQYRISFVFSAVLVLSMLVKDVRDSAFVWLFLPIIILPVILVFRGLGQAWLTGCDADKENTIRCPCCPNKGGDDAHHGSGDSFLDSVVRLQRRVFRRPAHNARRPKAPLSSSN